MCLSYIQALVGFPMLENAIADSLALHSYRRFTGDESFLDMRYTGPKL